MYIKNIFSVPIYVNRSLKKLIFAFIFILCNLHTHNIHFYSVFNCFVLQSLRVLNLAENSIDVLYDRPFFMLTNLQYLDLSGNMLQDLPPEVFKDVQVIILIA